MVKVEIVDEKESNSPYASGSSDASDSSESLSSVDSDISNEESIFDRLAALVDIVPPTTRHKISSGVASTGSFLKTAGKRVGNIVWIVTTSALLVGLPLAVSLEDEAKVVAQEREQQEQQAGQQMLSSGMYSPSSSSPKPLVPPGF
jgi:import receptor subunit TOM22